MTLDTTINLPTIVTLGLAIVAGIVWLVRLEGRVNRNSGIIDEMIKDRGALEALINLTREQLHEYQLQVAKDYVTHSVVNELKRDIITEIGRVELRVETQITRLIEAKT